MKGKHVKGCECSQEFGTHQNKALSYVDKLWPSCNLGCQIGQQEESNIGKMIMEEKFS